MLTVQSAPGQARQLGRTRRLAQLYKRRSRIHHRGIREVDLPRSAILPPYQGQPAGWMVRDSHPNDVSESQQRKDKGDNAAEDGASTLESDCSEDDIEHQQQHLCGQPGVSEWILMQDQGQ